MSGGEPLAMAFSICTIANVCIKNGGIRAYCFVTALMACGVARGYVFESGIPSESTNTQRSQQKENYRNSPLKNDSTNNYENNDI